MICYCIHTDRQCDGFARISWRYMAEIHFSITVTITAVTAIVWTVFSSMRLVITIFVVMTFMCTIIIAMCFVVTNFYITIIYTLIMLTI